VGSYYLANTGTGANKWIVTRIVDEGKSRKELNQWNGRSSSSTFLLPFPTDPPPDDSFYPAIGFSYRGGGWVEAAPYWHTVGSFGSSRFSSRFLYGAYQLFNLVDLEVQSSGMISGSSSPPGNTLPSTSTSTTSGGESFTYHLISPRGTISENGNWSYAANEEKYVIVPGVFEPDTGTTSGSLSETNTIPRRVRPDRSDVDSYSRSDSFDGYYYSVNDKAYQRTDITEHTRRTPLCMGIASGGYWQESILYRRSITVNSDLSQEYSDPTVYYLNDATVSGTAPKGQLTVANNKLYGVTQILQDINKAKLETGTPGDPWDIKKEEISYFPIPQDAIILDYSYHP